MRSLIRPFFIDKSEVYTQQFTSWILPSQLGKKTKILHFPARPISSAQKTFKRFAHLLIANRLNFSGPPSVNFLSHTLNFITELTQLRANRVSC